MDELIKTNEQWLEYAKDLYNTQQHIKVLEKKAAELTVHLKTITNNTPLSYGGMKYYFEERTGSVDYSAIPELQKVNLDFYRKPPIRVWKLVVDKI